MFSQLLGSEENRLRQGNKINLKWFQMESGLSLISSLGGGAGHGSLNCSIEGAHPEARDLGCYSVFDSRRTQSPPWKKNLLDIPKQGSSYQPRPVFWRSKWLWAVCSPPCSSPEKELWDGTSKICLEHGWHACSLCALWTSQAMNAQTNSSDSSSRPKWWWCFFLKWWFFFFQFFLKFIYSFILILG